MAQDKKITTKEYQQSIKKFIKKFDSDKEKIMTWGLGIAGESGDIAGCIKKTFIHENDQTQGIRENLGDVLWYIAAICNFYNWDMIDILKENIDKLEKRYPEGFKIENAKKKQRIDWNEK